MEKAPVLTKKDCVKGAIRWSLMAITTFNYDTQLAPAVVFGIGPLLRKIYKDDDEYVEALNNHYKYFNTMPWLANIVLGATLALEDKEGITSLDAVQMCIRDRFIQIISHPGVLLQNIGNGLCIMKTFRSIFLTQPGKFFLILLQHLIHLLKDLIRRPLRPALLIYYIQCRCV